MILRAIFPCNHAHPIRIVKGVEQHFEYNVMHNPTVIT